MLRRGAKGGASAQESLKSQALGRSRGGFSTKIHVMCEGGGLPITVLLSPGETHESTMLDPLLSSVNIGGKPGAPRRRFEVVSGDKGYDGETQRAIVRAHGSMPLIPRRRKKDGSYPTEAEGFDKERYKKRNVIERLIGKLKEFRRVATRFDKLAESFRCFVIIGFIRIWLRQLLLDRA
jgi:transposase